MKKALIVLLILGVAGGLFAQSVSWSGGVGTGLFIKFGDAYDDPCVVADDDDTNDAIHGFLAAEYDADSWGLKIQLDAGYSVDHHGVFGLTNAYGWMNFLNKIINVKAGLIDDGVWGTELEADRGVATGGGVRIEIMPIDGLNLGLFFSYPDHGIAAGKIGNFFQETAFGFEYSMANMFRAAVALKLYSEESEYTGYDGMDVELIYGFAFTGIPNLLIGLSGGIDNLANFSDYGDWENYVEVSYKISSLGFGIVLGQHIFADEGLIEFGIKPWLEYAINDSFSVGLDIPFTFDTWDGFKLAEVDMNLWGKYTLGGSWVQLGYGFEMHTADFGDSLDHYIKVIFGYSF